jgi:leucyl-tRNA synthetase
MNDQPATTRESPILTAFSPASDAGHTYDWKAIEARWQHSWQQADAFATPDPAADENTQFIFAACPFTSGGAHMGHVRSYTLADTYARYRRANGTPVLFPMGFDAFGLPSELGAINRRISPQEWVDDCYQRMRRQFTEMGFSFDWDRTFRTSDENIYLWSQRLFLKLRASGLIYQGQARVDWCDSCETVLAKAQVEDGCCWRCGNSVRLIDRLHWFLRTSAYNAENSNNLKALDGWDKQSLGAQEAVLGRIDGVEMEALSLAGQRLTIFTPHAEKVSDAAFVALSPRHPELDEWLQSDASREMLRQVRSGGWERPDRTADAVPIVDAGVRVSVPGVDRLLPVIVSPYVDARFGPTAVLGIPGADAADNTIAQRLAAIPRTAWRPASAPTKARRAMRYLARDFPVSRQRAWGTPIPLIHCPRCGTVPVDLDELPVTLPPDLQVTGAGNALAARPDFVECTCPSCQGPARRETDTLDCHLDGIWIWLPFCVPADDREHQLFTHPDLRRWLPGHLVIWGIDGGNYMANMRAIAKMLRDIEVLDHIPDGEPFARALMHEMVRVDGHKMSKHLGNVVDPEQLISRFGADTVRLAVLYAAAPHNGINWSGRELEQCHTFLERLWAFARPRLQGTSSLSRVRARDEPDKLRRRLAGWCDTAISKVTNDLETLQMHRAARNIMLLLTRIEDFESRAELQRGALDEEDRRAIATALLCLVQISAPLMPHLAEELWRQAGHGDLLALAPWPEARADM